MRIQIPWIKNRRAVNDLASVENALAGILQPVRPSHEFVGGLRSRLLSKNPGLAFGSPNKKWQNALLVGGAVVSAIVLLVAGIRALISLLGTLGLLHQLNQQTKNKRTATVRQAL